jgi:hypothetical protein
MSRRMPKTARIWDTLTLGTTDEKASTNSYANLNHPTSSSSEFENVKLRAALSIMYPVTNGEPRYFTLTSGKVNNPPRRGILPEMTVKPYGYDSEIQS